jgi:lipopolysaccharide transport system ATP-binding protein
MSERAISVDNLGKLYRIGEGQQYTTLREKLTDLIHLPFRALHRKANSSADPPADTWLWALRNLSFEIKRGELVGIIGRNGAGKSTLLKVLSRITEPTEGYAEMHGRVGSLLEVGTGFHPELTGRENIYLNGAILGMRKAEIARKFDEIVAFAETERFLDTAVKFYSSGMYMRLAFAVAAHMDTEILIVDEVLAVGDAAFQKKCLGKMGEVRGSGRTVLFVSHNMNAIEQLCNRVILLDHGNMKRDSNDIRSVVTEYVLGADPEDNSVWLNSGSQCHNPYFTPMSVALVDYGGNPLHMPVRNDDEIWLETEGEIELADPALVIGYAIYAEDGNLLYWSYSTDQTEPEWPAFTPGRQRLRTKIPPHLLNEGSYRIELVGSLYYRQWLFASWMDAPRVHLTVQGGLSDSPYWTAKRPGLLAPLLRWEQMEPQATAICAERTQTEP